MKKSYNLRLCYFGLLCRKFFITAWSRAKRVSRKVLKENCIKESEGNEQQLAKISTPTHIIFKEPLDISAFYVDIDRRFFFSEKRRNKYINKRLDELAA